MNKDFLLMGAAIGTMLLLDYQRRAADKETATLVLQRQAHVDAKAKKKAREQSKNLQAANDKIKMLENGGKGAKTKTTLIATATTFGTFWLGANLPGVFPVVQTACRTFLGVDLPTP